MKKFKVYVTDYDYDTLKYEEQIIRGINAELIPLQCKTDDEVIEKAKDADALLVQYTPITNKVFKKLKGLKVVSRYGVGVDCVDIASATKHGVIVTNVPDYGVAEVSDHAMALILNIIRKITFLVNDVKNGGWDFKSAGPVTRLSEMTLGVIGAGRIGKELVRKAKVFGFKILIYDPNADSKIEDDSSIKMVDFDTLLNCSDIISIHAPLYHKTEHMFNKEAFTKMKKGSYIINTARGGLIEESALIEAIENGTIIGAALDVCEVEPLPSSSKLRGFANVEITPHFAWYSEEAKIDLQTKAAEEILRVLGGKTPKNPVNDREY